MCPVCPARELIVKSRWRLHTSDIMAVKMNKAVDLKGNMYTLMSVVLNLSDLQAVRRDLAERVLQAPGFFQNTPVIVDFSSIDISDEFDFNALFKIIRQHKLLPVAVRGIADEMRVRLQSAGVPIVEQARAAKNETSGELAPHTDKMRSKAGSTLVIDRPVKAKQQCVAENGDLVILASVSASAELIADGNIHVYGTLRGRALCGVRGNTEARIFCTSLEAGLVSVAGRYKVLKKIPSVIKNKPVQIRLKDEKLLVEPL